MTQTADLLFELGCEELPTSALKAAGKNLEAGIIKRLQQAGLDFESVHPIASPRRLGVLIRGLATRQPDQVLNLRGPSKAVAYKDGAPTPALLGFCRKQGIEPEQLQEVETPKGTWLEFQGVKHGLDSEALLPELLKEAVDQLPLPKRMRWGATRAEFTRPVLWLVAMLGQQVLALTLFDRTAGRQTRGHRVHSPDWIQIDSPADYFTLLESHRVIADFEDRAARVKALAQSLSTPELTVVTEPDLVDEVAALVEWPVPLMGQFASEFLDVPEEALVSSMKEHQKYFHVKHADGSLANYFVTMANLESKDPSLVVAGNERVLNARLADAKFFWDTDLKTPLADRLGKLDKIVFHEELGSLGDKSRRAGTLAATIAKTFGTDPSTAQQASQLAKCDLLSEMVLEFSDLQGLMGTYYARHEGYPADVAEALVEVYKPAGAKDSLPQTPVGSTIAVADKLDSLVGLFAINQPPTGSKDPFALRRAALGILRIVRSHGAEVDLAQWIQSAADGLSEYTKNSDTVAQVSEFVAERLKVMLQDEGIQAETYAAVLGAHPPLCPVTIASRCHTLQGALGGDDLRAVAAGGKRVANLLGKAEQLARAVDASLFETKQERALDQAVIQAQGELTTALANNDFATGLQILGSLRGPIDAFFTDVMVNDDRDAVRQNRLALLSQLSELFKQVADLSVIST